MALGEKTKLLWQNPEYRKHMSEVHKGKPSGMKGKITPIEVRIKQSLSHTGKINEKASNWQGGISKIEYRYGKTYCREWRHKKGISKKYISKYGGIIIPKKIYNQKRKALLKGGELTIKTIQLVYEDNIKLYGTLTCYLCLKTMQFGNDSLEHKIPLCRGGTNEKENLAIACQNCNSKKGKKTEVEYRKEILHESKV